MTDELVKRLREIGKFSFGWTADQAADRIEQLTAERDQWIAHTKNAVWADSEELKLAEAERDALTAERDAALASNRGLIRLNEATEARANRLQDALEEIAEYDTGATAGLAYTARAALKGESHE